MGQMSRKHASGMIGQSPSSRGCSDEEEVPTFYGLVTGRLWSRIESSVRGGGGRDVGATDDRRRCAIAMRQPLESV